MPAPASTSTIAARTWSAPLAEVRVPAAQMHCHPTRLGNIYAATIETVLLEPELLPAQTATLHIGHATSRSLPEQRKVGRRGTARTWLERVRRGPRVDLGERLVYDARWVDNTNVAHLFQHHLAALGLARKALGVGPAQCLVVLESQATPFARGLFALAGYETCETNLPVRANFLRFDIDRDVPYHLLRHVGELEPAGLDACLPKRIFISRRGTRRLLNEANVVASLRERGFETVYFESLSLREQWSLVRHAEVIAAIHGAALGHLATRSAAPELPFKLLELFSPGLVADCFRKYAAALGGRWAGCRGKLTPEFVRCLEGADPKALEGAHFELDPATLERAFTQLGE
ncbi:MAG: glycosyltransferase family 61 protein [Caldimonas sp.]